MNILTELNLMKAVAVFTKMRTVVKKRPRMQNRLAGLTCSIAGAGPNFVLHRAMLG
jgi:hypothetical protein